MSILRFLFAGAWGRNEGKLKSKGFYSIENSNMCVILHLVSKSRKSSSVPGQALGFSLQHTKMAGLLASLESGAAVEYEGLDDLTVYHPTGEMELWQIKSALVSNPQADRSVELWKTLANWCTILNDGKIAYLQNKLFFYFYVTNEVNEGNITRSFNAAKTEQEIESSINLAKEILSRAGKDVTTFSNIFFDSPLPIQKYIIKNFSLKISQQGVYQEMDKFVKFLPPNKHKDILDHAYGWVKRKVDNLTREKLPAIVRSEEFIIEIRAYIRKYSERNILRSIAPQIIDESEQKKLEQKFFVKQLELIDFKYDDILDAINDYYRAQIDRTNWSDSGELHSSTFEELDDNLRRKWKSLTYTLSMDDPKLFGRTLYGKCINENIQLEGLEPPNHFIPGCYHKLSDNLEIGWHRNYKNHFGI